jgi:hypothetical protein
VTVTSAEVLLVVSVDTEEDNWVPTRTGITVANIPELRRLARSFERWGVRASYFTTYQVAAQAPAVDVLREIQAGGSAEIGAHLHPWNTPPFEEPLLPRHSMMKNLPRELQLAKLQRLTATLRDAFGVAPTAFRAGRFGLGTSAVSALASCGYQVDSSVTPFVSWEATDEGPTFVGAPLDVYRIGVGQDVTVPDPVGPLVEVPLTCGYTGFSSRRWRSVHGVLQARPWRWLRVAGLAARLGVTKLTILTPEVESVRSLLALSRAALRGGVRHLQLFLHSLVLRPGLSPWTSSVRDVERIYGTIESYLDGLSKTVSVRFATASEAAIALGCGGPSSYRPPAQRVVQTS